MGERAELLPGLEGEGLVSSTFGEAAKYPNRNGQRTPNYVKDPMAVYVAPSKANREAYGLSSSRYEGKDTNEGTAGRPLASLQTAMALVADGGTVFLYDDSTYSWSEKQTISKAGVTIRTIHGGKATITGDRVPVGASNHIIDVRAANCVVQDLIVDCTNSPTGYGGYHGISVGVGGGGSIVQDAIVVNPYAGGLVITGAYSGGVITWTDDVTVRRCEVSGHSVRNYQDSGFNNWVPGGFGNFVRGLVFEGCLAREGQGEGFGMRVAKKSGTRNNRVENCIAHDVYSVCIYNENIEDIDLLGNNTYSSGISRWYRTYDGGLTYHPAVGFQFAQENDPSGTFVNRRINFSDNVAKKTYSALKYSSFGAGLGIADSTFKNLSAYQSSGAMVVIDASAGHSNNVFSGCVFEQHAEGIFTGGMTSGSATGFTWGPNGWFNGTPGGAFTNVGDVTGPTAGFPNPTGYDYEDFVLAPGAPGYGLGADSASTP